jgi:DNA-binding GntR family transcriptional regulator
MSANKSILTISNDVSRSANSKPQIAYDLIKDAIIKNELKPETLLVERQLCDYL